MGKGRAFFAITLCDGPVHWMHWSLCFVKPSARAQAPVRRLPRLCKAATRNRFALGNASGNAFLNASGNAPVGVRTDARLAEQAAAALGAAAGADAVVAGLRAVDAVGRAVVAEALVDDRRPHLTQRGGVRSTQSSLKGLSSKG